VANLVRGRVKALGLKLFPDEKFASNTISCIRAPEGVEVKGMLKYLREEEGIILAGGQGMLDGKTFRIGHLGWVNEKDGEAVMDGVEKALARAGYVRAG
jgi:aspartate aminotransferase-like enzyme